MTSGLRRSGTKGPKGGVPREALKASAAFFCSSSSSSAARGGMRSSDMIRLGLPALRGRVRVCGSGALARGVARVAAERGQEAVHVRRLGVEGADEAAFLVGLALPAV